MTSYAGRSAADLAAAVRSGLAAPRAVVAEHLDRIAALDARLGAFQVVRREAALAEADAVAARPDLGGLPLAGVPVAVKDNIAVAGEPMRDGTRATSDEPSPADHEVVRRLREAGAVVVGVTRVPELCVFGATDSAFGVTRNPWDPDRSPGGSSGGSAAAVAAGLVPVAHGNDGMGSIRIPAACCGLVGLKPGLGTVPAGIGGNDWYAMAENGPLATTVADAALMLSVLAADPGLAAVAQPDRSLRIAVSVQAPAVGVPVDPGWAAAATHAAELLAGIGHQVWRTDPPAPAFAARAAAARWVAGTEQDARTLPDRQLLARRVRVHAGLGRAALRLGLVRDQDRVRWRSRVGQFFTSYDVLLTPALAQSPLLAVAWEERGWLRNVVANTRYAPFAAPWNLAGYPAAVVPTGLGDDGLPRAVQLVAPDGGEALLLGLAAQLERLQPWPRYALERPGPT